MSNSIPNMDAFKSACQQAFNAAEFNPICTSLTELAPAYQDKRITIIHPRDVIPLHENIIAITKRVKTLGLNHDVCLRWQQILESLHYKPVFRVGLGFLPFDCGHALSFMKADALKPEELLFEELDKTQPAAVEKVLASIAQAEETAFGTYFPDQFTRPLLTSLDSRCLLAKDRNQNIVGFVWGFTLNVNKRRVFHTFALARKVELAKLGIGKLLATQGIAKIKNVDAISLNVNLDNQKAIELYRSLGFETPPVKEDTLTRTTSDKIFMIKDLSKKAINITSSETNKARTFYLLNYIGYVRLGLYELIRRLTLLWKSIIYSKLFVR